jgi:hypothetical protein
MGVNSEYFICCVQFMGKLGRKSYFPVHIFHCLQAIASSLATVHTLENRLDLIRETRHKSPHQFFFFSESQTPNHWLQVRVMSE